MTVTPPSVFRTYEPSECGDDGYPLAWHRLTPLTLAHDAWEWCVSVERLGTGPWLYGPVGGPGVKHIVRAQAKHRCVRCLHPFIVGETPGEWSPCDAQCTHGGVLRWRAHGADGWSAGEMLPALAASYFADVTMEVEAATRVLTVHHLNGHKHDLRWFNLAALCQRCHLSVQNRVTMEVPYPWAHTEWSRPYVAGFYAAKYLGENLPREAIEARLDELLALGQRYESVERMPV